MSAVAVKGGVGRRHIVVGELVLYQHAAPAGRDGDVMKGKFIALLRGKIEKQTCLDIVAMQIFILICLGKERKLLLAYEYATGL